MRKERERGRGGVQAAEESVEEESEGEEVAGCVGGVVGVRVPDKLIKLDSPLCEV